MPSLSSFRKRRRTMRKRPLRRRRTRRSGYRKQASTIPSQLMGFPKNRVVKMRYCDKFELDADNTGAATDYIFRANSIYDPDYSGTGHQPIGHDQWMVFYNQYTVIGSKIKVTFRSGNNSTTNSLCGVYLKNDISSLTDPLVIMENNMGKWRNIQMITNGNVVTITTKFSAKKFFNLSNIKDNQGDYGAQFGAGPNTEAFYHVWTAVGINGGVDPPKLDCYVEIDYLVLLSNPNTLAQS